MKILIVGDFHSDVYEEAFAKAFSALGHSVERFATVPYFKDYTLPYLFGKKGGALKPFWYKFQNKFSVGPAPAAINRDLAETASRIKPDLVFLYRAQHIRPATISHIKENAGCPVLAYHNDDPFQSATFPNPGRFFTGALNLFDWIFVYRQKNVDDCLQKGCSKVSILKPYYLKARNYPLAASMPSKYSCDVIFIGHYEPDGRDALILKLLDVGVDLKLYGTEWHRSPVYGRIKTAIGEVGPVFGDYNLAINSAKIALAFVSKANSDTYTRRCYEIPAAGVFMLCEYTQQMASMLSEGVEAEYFRTPEELLAKVKYYLAAPEKRAAVAKAGYDRIISGGNEVADRVAEVLDVYDRNFSKRL